MELHERAEDYPIEDILHFNQICLGIGYEKTRIEEFCTSEVKKILHIYAERGRGKTFLLRLAMSNFGKSYTYYSYYKNRKFPDDAIMSTDNILVIDDIHYMVDDLRAGKIKTNDIVMVLVNVLQRAVDGKKTIILSEDVFTEDYIPNTRYRGLYKHFCASEICDELAMCITSTESVCKTLGVNPYSLTDRKGTDKFVKFMEELNPTPRGITAFIMKHPIDWHVIVDNALKAYLKDEDAYNSRISRRVGVSRRRTKTIISERMHNYIELFNGRIPKNWEICVSKEHISYIRGKHDVYFYDKILHYANIYMRDEIHTLLYMFYSKDALSSQGYYKELLALDRKERARGTLNGASPYTA